MLGILTILISKRQSVSRNLCVIWMVLVTFGVLEEYRQYFVPNRSAEFLDGVANLLGVTFGLVVPVLIYYMIIQRNHRLMKLLFLYGMILTPLMFGLLFIDEIPFVTLEEPIGERLRNLVALIGV